MKGKRLRFTDDQRRRLAAKGKTLGSKVLQARDAMSYRATMAQRKSDSVLLSDNKTEVHNTQVVIAADLGQMHPRAADGKGNRPNGLSQKHLPRARGRCGYANYNSGCNLRGCYII